VKRAVESLTAQDRVMIVSFDDRAADESNGWVDMDAAGVARIQQVVAGLAVDGGTNVFGGLECAYDRLDADRPTGIVLVSDGVANTGPCEYRDLIELARKHDVRLFTFVIGNESNAPMLEDLATLSGGHAVTISTDEDVAGQLLLARSRMSHEALHGVDLELEGGVVGHPARLPSLYLGQQLIVVGRYEDTGASTLRVRAKVSGEHVTWTLPVELPEVDESVPEIERLYALAAIRDLQREAWLEHGDEDEARGAIVDLALNYSLVTDYTSMIVVEEERKTQYGIGNANADRRAAECAAAQRRSREGHVPQIVTGSQPLGGGRAEHAPTRRSSGGAGAVGIFHLLAVAGLGAVAWSRRRKQS